MATDREVLRATFDTAAAQYGDARPGYPDALFADLIAETGVTPSAALLEIGCGPGTATIALAGAGFAITAVELGASMAATARRRLAEFPRVSVITSAFEQWDPGREVAFDLIYAATAWKWVDPTVKYERAAALLRPGGHLAVWAADHAFPEGFDPFFTDIQRVYDEIDERIPVWPPPPPDERIDTTADEFVDSGRFEVTASHRYLWSIDYSADSYIALLDTFSGHIAMSPAKRGYLYREIRRRLAERPDDRVTRHWSATLTVGRRR